MTTLTPLVSTRPLPYGRAGMVRHARETAPNSILATMLTVDEAAAYIGRSTDSLYNYRHAGTGPKSFKYKGRVLYKRADLDEWKAGRA